MTDAKARMIGHVVQGLRNNRAKNLSDAEIERALAPCCGAGAMIPYAKQFRDEGLITPWLPPLPERK
jgi:hypothetical protein